MNLKSRKVLKNRIDGHGYEHVLLYKNGKHKNYKVHRLVAKTFIPNPLNLPQVDHIDEKKDNNNVSNLRWVTASENTRHSIYKQSCKINQLDKNDNLIKTWDSSHQIERETGYHATHIIKSCKGERKQAYGYKWQYTDGLNQQRSKRPVAALTKDGEFVAKYKSAAEASRCLKINYHCIYHCLNGKFKSTHGLRFIYID